MQCCFLVLRHPKTRTFTPAESAGFLMGIYMRYLFVVFFIFIYSQLAFSAPDASLPVPSVTGSCEAVCSNQNQNCGSYAATRASKFFPPGTFPGGNPSYGYLCGEAPTCTGSVNSQFHLGQCECISPNVFDSSTNACGPAPENTNCAEDQKVYDPVSGTMVCPGSGDGSSSASSQNCVVPGDYDGDCVPDNQSSSASSGAASSAAPSSAAGSSSGNDSSSGSGSSSGNSGGDGSGSGPGTGGGTGGGTGSNSSWTPNSGYGNWIPVSEGSNCPNKYEDSNGQWWCAGASGGGGGGSGSSAGAGECDPTASDYWQCITKGNSSSSGSSGSSACSSNSPDYVECSGKLGDGESKLTELGEKFSEDIDTLNDDFESALDEDLSDFEREGVPFSDAVNFFKNRIRGFLPSPSSCIPPVFEFWGNNYELDCYLFDVLKQAIGWVLAILTAINVFQIAIRPVDR